MESSNEKQQNSNKVPLIIPDGLERCLVDFTVDVLKANPTNIIDFAAKYFTNKLQISNKNIDEFQDSKMSIKIYKDMKPIRTNQILSNESFEDENSLFESKFCGKQLRRNSIFTRTYNPENDTNDSKKENNNNDSNNKSITSKGECSMNTSFDYECETDKLNEDNKEKSLEIKVKLAKILRSIVMFKHLYDDDLNLILDNMFEKRCVANEVIIKEGDDGNYFYVIDKGKYEIYKNQNSKLNEIYIKKIGEYKNNGFFGELALLYNQPRSATIISAENDGILWAMNRDTFQRLVISNAFKRRKMYEEFLKSVPLLQECMNDYERTQVADSLITHTFKNHDCIIRDGDAPNGMYFIEEGEVRILKENLDGNIVDVLLVKGDYFGELALINKTHRSASAYCYSSICKVAFLDIDAFERLMGPCIDVFKQNINNYNL